MFLNTLQHLRPILIRITKLSLQPQQFLLELHNNSRIPRLPINILKFLRILQKIIQLPPNLRPLLLSTINTKPQPIKENQLITLSPNPQMRRPLPMQPVTITRPFSLSASPMASSDSSTAASIKPQVLTTTRSASS